MVRVRRRNLFVKDLFLEVESKLLFSFFLYVWIFEILLSENYILIFFMKNRFASLSGITENGIKTLNLLNIQNVFDFRSTPEVQDIGFA